MKWVILLISLLLVLTACSTIEKEKERLTEEITEKEIARITEEKTREIIGGTSISKQQPCTIEKTIPKLSHAKYYTGPLIDTHVHMPVSSKIVSTVAIQSGFEDMPAYNDKLNIDYLTCLFESEGIIQTFGFHIVPNLAIESSLSTIQVLNERYGDKYAHFYMPTQLGSLNPDPEKVDEILTNNPFFKGYGEVKFDFNEIGNEGIEDPQYLEAYSLADKHNLVIMMHPASNHKSAVMRLLNKHPNTNFLFHSGNIEGWIAEVLENHKNAYYSLDANVAPLFGWASQHDLASATKQEFMEYMNNNFNNILQEEVRQWKPLIEEYPNQFTWGTDRWYTWHFDEDVGAMLEEFGRSFIAELDPEVQEKFAYKNAQKMMEE